MKAQGGRGEQKYSSTLSLTSALDGVGGQRHFLVALHKKLNGAYCRGCCVFGRVRNVSSPNRTIQTVASRYTD